MDARLDRILFDGADSDGTTLSADQCALVRAALMELDRYRQPDAYTEPVNGIQPAHLSGLMRDSIKAVAALWPKGTGVILFTFDFGKGGGLSYISNGDRRGSINLLREWIRKMERMP